MTSQQLGPANDSAVPPDDPRTDCAAPGGVAKASGHMVACGLDGVPAPRADEEADVDAVPAVPPPLPTEHLAGLAGYERLAAVASLDLLNPDLVARLDEISRRTMQRLGHEAAYVSIVLDSAQLILSSAGMSGWICQTGGTPIEWSFCGHTVALGRPYVVEDAAVDPAHQASPLVTLDGTRAYAGVPLISHTGQVLGAHCVIDSEPHHFTEDEIDELQSAATEIVAILAEHTLPATSS